jgi:hypothetical protein
MSRNGPGAARSAAPNGCTTIERSNPMTSTNWPLERALFALAGTVILVSVLLAVTVTPWFLALTAFTGVSQWLYVLFGDCPASIALRRLSGLEGCAR